MGLRNAAAVLIFMLFQTVGCDEHSSEPGFWKNEVDVRKLQSLISQPYAAVFYATSDGPQDALEKRFNKYFENAGAYLEDFGVKTGIVNCFRWSDHQECGNKKDESNKVYFYRNGRLLTDLPMDTMFNVDAIVANFLHLVLLQEVPLLQTKAELKKATFQAIGKHDIIFGRLKAVGIPEHRSFIEAAFAYNRLFKFVMTTVNDNFGIDKNWEERTNGIWLLKCKDTKQGELCPVVPYTNTINIENLVVFIRGIQLPNTLELPESSYANFLHLNLPLVFLSGVSKDMDSLRATMKTMAWEYQGTLGFILVNRDTYTPEMEAQWNMKDFPPCSNVCAYLKAEDLLEMISDGFTEDELRKAVKSFVALWKSRNEQQEYEEEEEEEYETEVLYNTSQETQDSPVEAAIFKLQLERTLNFTATEQLTDKTFPEFIASSSVTFVLFTVRWNAVCLSFLETYQAIGLRAMDLTGSTFNPLARVECSDWPDVCTMSNVTMYPTLKIYHESVNIGTYHGRLDEVDMLRAYMLYSSASPVRLSSKEEFNSVCDGSHPSWTKELLPSLVFGAFSDQNVKEQDLFLEVTRELRGSVLAYVCTTESIHERFGIFTREGPSVVTVKQNDPHEPFISFSGPFTKQNLIGFISNSSRYILPELTPASLPSLLGGNPSIVMLFHQRNSASDQAEAELAKVAKARWYNSPPITWIDTQEDSSLGSSLLRDYSLPMESDGPHLLYLNRKLNSICWYPHTPQYSENLLTDWLQSVLGGWGESCAAALRHREWTEMVPGYDFLTFIREDREAKPGNVESVPSGRLRHPTHHKDATMKGDINEDDDNELGERKDPAKSHITHTEL